MPSQRAANIVFAGMLIAAAAWFAWTAEGFRAAGLLASSGLPSKFFPQLVLGLLALCAALVAWRYGARGQEGGDAGARLYENAGEARRGLAMIAVAVICYLIWTRIGFAAMAVVLGPLSLAAMGVRAPLIYLAVWALTGLVWLLFAQVLGVRLG